MSFPFMAALSWKAIATEYVSTSTFRVGQLGMTEDGSLYRLCKAGAALTNTLAAKINAYTYLEACTGDCAEAATSGAIAAGDRSFTFLDTSTVAADYYKDGYAVIPSGTYDSIRHINRSDAGAGTSVKVYVDDPYVTAYASGGTMACYPSPWKNIKNPTSYSGGYEHFACMINMPITTGYFFWGKVRGPHWCWVGLGTWPGAASEDRDVVFHTNGSIDMADKKSTAAVSPQRAGYLMFSGTYGDALIMMQIE